MTKPKTKNTKRRSYTSRRSLQPAWTTLKTKQLLELRICDLGLTLEGTPLEQMVQRLYREMGERDIKLKPHCWLSDDWFSPDGIPGIAIPFYMGHPKLLRLEKSEMLEAEGSSKSWCMKILRHEAGHAVDTAYRLHRRKKYREIFGRYSAPYPDYYRPRPHSKSYVMHLEPWYAQSHPSEDFAETFAVWLTPRKNWRKEYKGWRALKKLEYVDELMSGIAGQRPSVTSRAKEAPVSRIKKTLRKHYDERHARYGIVRPKSFDHDLKKLFSQTPKSRKNITAAAFLEQNRPEFCRVVAHWTGDYRYNINQVLREMIERCREMDLHVVGSVGDLKQSTLTMLTVHTMNFLHGGHHRVAL